MSRSSASASSSSASQVLEAAREVEHGAPGVGQDQLLGAAVDQLLAQLGLEPLHRQRDRGLRAEQLLGRAREAALADDGGEDLQGVELHRPPMVEHN